MFQKLTLWAGIIVAFKTEGQKKLPLRMQVVLHLLALRPP